MKKIIDLHCDTISFIAENWGSLRTNSAHFDLVRAGQTGICLQFFALFTPPDDSNAVLRRILKMVQKYHQEMSLNRDLVYPLLEFNDMLTAENQDKIGCLLHLEGAEALGHDVELLQVLYLLGLRSIGLTWNYRNMMADGVSEGNADGGLSSKGRQLLDEMSRLGVILDLAHLGERSYFDALEHYNKPLIVSHANAAGLCPHRRNLSDDQLAALQQNGGIIGVTAVKDFIGEKDGIEGLIDHIAYISDLIGCQHVALGSDFDGADNMVLRGVEGYQNLDERLEKRGFKPGEIENILWGNAVRILKAIL